MYVLQCVLTLFSLSGVLYWNEEEPSGTESIYATLCFVLLLGGTVGAGFIFFKPSPKMLMAWAVMYFINIAVLSFDIYELYHTEDLSLLGRPEE